MNYEMRTNQNSRRGVTLLFTISMIVLFLLMGTTFVVVANDYFKTAIRRSRLNTFKVDTVALMDRAFQDALRGPSLNDESSPLRGMGLLSDMYGFGFKGTLTGITDETTLGGNLIVLNVVDEASDLLVLPDPSMPLPSISGDANYVDGLLNGRVITFTSGPAAGYSTRIVSHAVVGGALQYVILRDKRGIDWSAIGAGDEYVVNGREFSGVGGGGLAGAYTFDPDALPSGILDPLSLEPVAVGLPRTDPDPMVVGLTEPGEYLSSSRSVNEPYDIPDHQNMHLAGQDGNGNTIPSFHRDRLYADYVASLGDSRVPSVDEIRRRVIRPFYVDLDMDGTIDIGSTANEDFPSTFLNENDGSLANPVNDAGGLDVDNDNDGTNDSVWIDIGLPLQTDSQGRRFRPLVAYHIVDLDGRLNLNAHGSHGDAATGSRDRHGIGVGPADISLSTVVGGDYEALLDDRYGVGGDNLPGNTNNSLTQGQKLFGHPVSPQFLGGQFASALPFLSERTLAMPVGSNVDDFPFFVAVSTVDLTSDPKLNANPYASDFGLGGGLGDNHFVAAELESIYRANDMDGSLLGGRLYNNYSTVRGNANKVTTDSYEVAIPATPRSIIELLRERMRAEGFTGSELQEVVREFITGEQRPVNRHNIATEMLLGGRFNLNRPLGNGRDEDGNGVVDDALEVGTITQRTIDYADVRQQVFGNPVFDLDNASDGNIGDAAAKVIMARQLYILALLIAGDNATSTSWATPYPALAAELGIPGTGRSGLPAGASATDSYRKAVAQWAVNMVDFRDTDSIITVFEYDRNPFNDPRVAANVVDGNPTTTGEADRGVVYGVERPELLLTETIAVHDRQLSDVATENETGGLLDNGDADGETVAGGDSDWDSARVPNTAAYIELYHPWRQTHGTDGDHQDLPRELTTNPTVRADGVHLSKLAPDNTPVWRIAVLRGENAADPFQDIRSIFFADPSASTAPSAQIQIGDAFYPSSTAPVTAPGEYTVVGTIGNVAGSNKFTFGRLASNTGFAPPPAEIDMTRSIELIPGAADTTGRVVVTGPVPGEDALRRCNTIVIDRSVPTGPTFDRGLSLSDPDGGYPYTASFDVETDGIQLKDGGFPPQDQARDQPFDAVATPGYRDADDIDAIWTNGIKVLDDDGDDYQFRVLHLQRLANPNLAYNIDSNPYITVDIANVDLLAFNGLETNPDNGVTGMTETGIDGGTTFTVDDGNTQMGGVERGERLSVGNGVAVARRNLFRYTEDRVIISADTGLVTDGHNFSYAFIDGSGQRLETLGERNQAYTDTTDPTQMVQFGSLAWNNRPYANHMEIANVPMLSAEGLIRHFGESETVDGPITLGGGVGATSDQAFSFFFGDDGFQHLPGFGSVIRGATTERSRFDILLDFIEVPNRFLGSETWLASNVTGTTAGAPNALLFNLNAPFHSIPNFRYPGKINLNTVYDADVWNALKRGFGDDTMLDFDSFRSARGTVSGPSDFGGLFTTTEGAEFVESGRTGVQKGQNQSLFRGTGVARTFDGANELDGTNEITDTLSSAASRNELRTRLGGLTTTRSSVYAIWITVGYFEVDQFGRVGAELGADEGTNQRNRAFYMVDRSIPVACEPGKNHNVDEAVLVRTIIE